MITKCLLSGGEQGVNTMAFIIYIVVVAHISPLIFLSYEPGI